MAARVRFKGDHLLIFFTICTVIEANRHSAVAKISPTPHEKKVSDLEGETAWRRERRGCGASHFQIAHNAAHTTTNVVASVSVARWEGIFVPPVWSTMRLAVTPIPHKLEKSTLRIPLPESYGGPAVVHVTDVPSDDKVAYGKYLADIGHCMECHTPMTRRSSGYGAAWSRWT